MPVLELKTNYNQQAVAELERLLEMAKAGEITELVAVYKTGLAFDFAWTGSDDLPGLIGWIETIKAKQIMRMFGEL